MMVRAHPAAAAEGSRERFFRAITGIKGNLHHIDRFVAQAVGGALETQPPHQFSNRLTSHGPEHALTVKTRERRLSRHFFDCAGSAKTSQD